MLNDRQIHMLMRSHPTYTKAFIKDFDKQWDEVLDKIRRSNVKLASIRLVPENK